VLRIVDHHLVDDLAEDVEVHVADVARHVLGSRAHHAFHRAVVGELDVADEVGGRGRQRTARGSALLAAEAQLFANVAEPAHASRPCDRNRICVPVSVHAVSSSLPCLLPRLEHQDAPEFVLPITPPAQVLSPYLPHDARIEIALPTQAPLVKQVFAPIPQRPA
jgi:hypothetical protein